MLNFEKNMHKAIIHHDTFPTIMAGCSGSAQSRLSKRRGSGRFHVVEKKHVLQGAGRVRKRRV